MPHEDGAAYAPVVATVSLGGGVCLDVMCKPGVADDSTSVFVPTRIFQEPRSLLITTGDAYRDLMHGIAATEVDENLSADTVVNWGQLEDGGRRRIEEDGGKSVRGTRVSLTYRDVLKVSLAASKVLGGFGKK
jgi:alkylated DNA repair protein alkB family protein 6